MGVRKIYWAGAGLVAASVMSVAGDRAVAASFDLGDDWQSTWNTTVSYGSAWRAGNADSKLYTQADGARIGNFGGTGGTSADAGDLNYKQGDQISSVFKVISDIGVKRDDMGAFVRVKAWYDLQKNADVAYGNQANGYTQGQSLSEKGFDTLQRFDGAKLLDAYAYNTFDVAEHPLQVRVGRQVINWGESLFVQGINQINPIDVPAFRHPGTEVKEGLLPITAAYANLGLGHGISVEGFYQFLWEPTVVDACGTYWSIVDTNVGTNPGDCNKITVGTASAASAISSGAYAPILRGHDGRNGGQGGVAVKIPAEIIDTEFGLYAMNINSRTPIISTNTGTWGPPAQPKKIL